MADDDSNCRPIALHDGFAMMGSTVTRIEAYMASIYQPIRRVRKETVTTSTRMQPLQYLYSCSHHVL